jgi:hypothetical protein
MRVHIHEIKLGTIIERRLGTKTTNEDTVEMPREAEWAETAIDTAAVVPRHETTETSNDGNTVEMFSDHDDDDDMEQLCGCAYCEGALLQFYPDYLSFIKRLSASEVNRRTMSEHRTMQRGNHIIQGFISALWSTIYTVTAEGDHILDVWRVTNDSYFCDRQAAIWKNQMVAGKLINQ